MTRSNTPAKTNADVQNCEQKGISKKNKKPVDVATLEKSSATSGNDPQSPGPVAAGEASS